MVRFHLDYLCQQTTAKKILRELDNLNVGILGSYSSERLAVTYDRVIEAIRRKPPDSVDLAMSILVWVVKAKRALKVEELQTAVSVELDRYELDELDIVDRTTLVDLCNGLIMIDANSNTGELRLIAHQFKLKLWG